MLSLEKDVRSQPGVNPGLCFIVTSELNIRNSADISYCLACIFAFGYVPFNPCGYIFNQTNGDIMNVLRGLHGH